MDADTFVAAFSAVIAVAAAGIAAVQAVHARESAHGASRQASAAEEQVKLGTLQYFRDLSSHESANEMTARRAAIDYLHAVRVWVATAVDFGATPIADISYEMHAEYRKALQAALISKIQAGEVLTGTQLGAVITRIADLLQSADRVINDYRGDQKNDRADPEGLTNVLTAIFMVRTISDNLEMMLDQLESAAMAAKRIQWAEAEASAQEEEPRQEE